MKKSIVIAVALALVVVLGAGVVWASNSQPASKATAKVGDIYIINSTDMAWDTILEQDIKTPNQKDLFIDVSLECGLYTQTHVKSKGGNKDTATAEAMVKVRVLVDGDEAYPGKVVFNYREQTLSAKFMGIFTGECLDVDPVNHTVTINYTCLEPEELNLTLDTMSANSFNFIMDDLTSGVHTVEVQAMIDTTAVAGAGTAEAWATIGRGSVTIELVRMIKGEDILLEE